LLFRKKKFFNKFCINLFFKNSNFVTIYVSGLLSSRAFWYKIIHVLAKFFYQNSFDFLKFIILNIIYLRPLVLCDTTVKNLITTTEKYGTRLKVVVQNLNLTRWKACQNWHLRCHCVTWNVWHFHVPKMTRDVSKNWHFKCQKSDT
jgi:hypothetical protein